MKKAKYRRILLKLSGEVLLNRETSQCIDPEVVARMSAKIKAVRDMDVEVAVVLGGGNIFRGALGEKLGVGRSAGDYMGMLATVINAIALQNALEKLGIPTRVQTAIEMHEVAEPFIHRKAMRHLEKGRVVICGAGTGNPYFTTDSAAALRASEIARWRMRRCICRSSTDTISAMPMIATVATTTSTASHCVGTPPSRAAPHQLSAGKRAAAMPV